MRVLAVIAARGGSKEIPRKNMRLMGGRPLIEYAMSVALQSPFIDDVVVTSDSDEILSFVGQFEDVHALVRHASLAGDNVTLDPVIFDAVVKMEEAGSAPYDVIVTLQPTSPLLSAATLACGFEAFAAQEVDSVISVVNAPRLSWTRNDNGEVVPAYEVRRNRQELPPQYVETGAFVISRRDSVTESSRLGSRIGVVEVPAHESVDIDTTEDWIVCEAMLSRKRVAFCVDGHRELGLGHVYRALTLAYGLVEHDVVFLCNGAHREGIDKLRSSHMAVVELSSDEELFAWLNVNRIDVFVNDRLDTAVNYVERVKAHVARFVSFEDLGPGARVADAVVNAIYEGEPRHSNTYAGSRYVCLRDEFLTARPRTPSHDVQRVVVMFGGTDPLNLSRRVYDLAKAYNLDNHGLEFEFIMGPGYGHAELEPIPGLDIEVMRDVARVSDHMRLADLAFCSQGRTTFELASMGVPTIVLAQNEREQLHTFATMAHGFINLGLGSEVSDEDLAASFEWLVGARSIREEMHRLMLETDLKSGMKRVRRIILGEVE